VELHLHPYVSLSTDTTHHLLYVILRTKYCTRPPSDPPPSQGISGGMETTGAIHEIKVTENSLFYCSWNIWSSTKAHTLPAHCLDTSKRVTWITFSCPSFYHALPKFKVRPVSPDFRIEAHWLKCAAPQTKITLLAIRHPFCHTILAPPSSSRCSRATKVAKQRTHGRNSFSEQNWLNLPMQTFIKKFVCVLNETLTSQGSLFPGSNLKRVASALILKLNCT